MVRRATSVLALLIFGLLAIPARAQAETALTRAVVETIRNQVQLLLQNQSARSARISDVLVPGDGLTTAGDSLAELRFNDGSLGRLGEQVVFRFTPGTRNFSLSNGTVLLLIPPGQGRTTIQTPNAAAGIQGSALFVRYIRETDTTVVGALTDSDIEVLNEDGSQRYVLAAGEMAVAVGDRITDIYRFDLRTFYETSNLARDFATLRNDPASESSESPANPSPISIQRSADPAIAAVQEEMETALRQRPTWAEEGNIESPDFIRLPNGSPNEFPEVDSDPVPPRSLDRSEPVNRQSVDAAENNPGRNPPGDRPGRASNPGRGPGDRPGRGPADNLGRGPGDRPGRGPADNLGRSPGDRPGRGPDQTPGRGPSDRPGRDPSDRPGRNPDRPGRGPGRGPDQGPGNNPGLGPDNNPGRGPGNNPGRGPGNNPGRGPGNNPGLGPDNNPGRGPGNNPGRGPGNNPGLGPDNNPGRGPGNNPDQGPGNAPRGRSPVGVDLDVDVGLGELDTNLRVNPRRR